MKTANRLSNSEYEALSLEYEKTPPKLSGTSGFITCKRENMLVTQLLPSNYARMVTVKANAMSMSPSKIIQAALNAQLAESV